MTRLEVELNRYFSLAKPVIYADLNVYRYLAYDELDIVEPERFIWAYSHTHLDEMSRGGNTDGLDGMAKLNAVEISDVLDANFRSVGNVRIFDPVDVRQRYADHLEAISETGNTEEILIEHIIRVFGADNFAELSMTPEQLVEQVEELTTGADSASRKAVLDKAKHVSIEMTESIDQFLVDQMPIDKTRNMMGIGSEKRKVLEGSDSPIDDIWELIKSAMGDTEKDVFFGFSPNPAMPEMPHNQLSAIVGAHTVLNMIGFSLDKGLANRNKILNIMSDSQHVAIASYCQGLLSSDQRLCGKARAIYQYIGSSANVLQYDYDPNGCEVRLGVQV